MSEGNKLWWRSVGPFLAVAVLVGLVNAASVLQLHGEGSQNDVAPLVWPAHYVVQKPDACVAGRVRSHHQRSLPRISGTVVAAR